MIASLKEWLSAVAGAAAGVWGVAVLGALLGLSPALGAFAAGLVVSESIYRHRIMADIMPFKDLFLAIFFVSVGLQIDLKAMAADWMRILGFSLLILLPIVMPGMVIALFLSRAFDMLGLSQSLFGLVLGHTLLGMPFMLRILATAAVLLSAAVVQAEVKLPSVIGEHMVLQRDREVPIWGWDSPGTDVRVTLGEAKVKK